jgi:DNA repair photolyase
MPPSDPRAPKGRGARFDPVNRFTEIEIVLDPEEITEDDLKVRTRYLHDTSRTVISTNSSPDVGFDASVNPYRGCEHGCSYCYARPTHEYLGLSAGLDFERVILVKRAAPALLERQLASRRWHPQILALSGVTDPYQPVERKLGITRGCLEVLARFRNPVGLITKNALVTRDVDVLAEMATWNGARVTLSITTLDPSLRQRLEPRTSTIETRLDAVARLAEAGVPVGVNIAPIIPGLTDQDVPALLKRAAEAGASHAGYTMLRLPGAVGPLFEAWLEANAPLRKDKILRHVREAHGGDADDTRYGRRMRGSGTYAEQVRSLFHLARQRAGIPADIPALATNRFTRPSESRQPALFGAPRE